MIDKLHGIIADLLRVSMSLNLGYPVATQSGKVSFHPPGTTKQCQTVYWIWGTLPTSTVPLIGIHGGPGYPHQCLLPLVRLAEASDNSVVILYDQIGCGESTHLPETRGDARFWSIDLFAAELQNLIDHLKISTYDILGHSCGGMIGATFALTQPLGLRKLVLFSTTPDFPFRVSEARRMRADLLPAETSGILEEGERNNTIKSPEYLAADAAFGSLTFCRLPEP